MNDNKDNLPAAAGSRQPCEEAVVVFCDGANVFCKALSSRLEDGYKKGINAMQMMNFKTCEVLPSVIVYKSSASDRGLLLNYCPWCGRPLNRKLLKDQKDAQGPQGERLRPAAGKESDGVSEGVK